MIAAEGEQKASRALREASNTIAESSSALQLRYLQVGTNSPSLVSIHGVVDSELNISREEFYDNISSSIGFDKEPDKCLIVSSQV